MYIYIAIKKDFDWLVQLNISIISDFISVSPFTAFISIICQKYSMVVYI